MTIETTPSSVIPTEISSWTEKLILRDVNGDQLQTTMADPSVPTTPPQGANFRSKEASVDAFVESNVSLMAIGSIDSIALTDSQNIFPAVKIVNREVDLSLEQNSQVPTNCP